jgi:nitrate/TMAO reductase-like tetraheme cytochrome c subunit
MHKRLGRWIKRALIGLIIIIPVAAVVTLLGVEVSSRPQFCASCHVMKPYYDSWRTSSHNGAACVECHIPPGIASEARKKYEALAMVARYFTGTYSTNPWAEVDDRSCLRSGCHEKRLLLSREVYRNVLFDHRPHLTELRRQKRLRCTSCHSQIVQGSHISVTASTCFLCHFKDTQLNQGTGRCTLCHEVPEKMITTAGLAFDHGEVKRFGMNCTLCHEEVVKGNGEVPRERCYTCHNEPARLKRYTEVEFMHRMHVTEHKVECLHCHIEILHAVPEREAVLAAACRSCHSPISGHSVTRDLYRGIGGKDVTPQPAAMYLAGVRCEACHTQPDGEYRRANEVSCMTCHGPTYLTIYRSWLQGLGKRTAGIRAELRQVQEKLAARNGAQPRAFLSNAEANLSLVERGKGVHNPAYALALLDRAHNDIRRALKASGETTLPPRPWHEAPHGQPCLKCHFGIEYLSGPAFGQTFPHMTHTVTARLACTVCHGGLEKHGTLKINAGDCRLCHEKIAQPMVDVASAKCLDCHTANIGPVSEEVNFPHERHIASGLDCVFCHSTVEEKPHRLLVGSADALPPLEHAFCGGCHADDVPAEDGTPPDNANCTKCHVDF